MNRGLEHVEIKVNDQGEIVLVCLCDCATYTEITLEIKVNDQGEIVLVCLCDCATYTEITLVGAKEAGLPEFAYTCDGCQSSHWISLSQSRRVLGRG